MSSNDIKKVKKNLSITDEQYTKCHAIIHTASVSCGGVGAGLAQIPLSDSAVIVPIQIAMITSLGAVFKVEVTETLRNSIIALASTSFVGRGIAQLAVGWIPGFGNMINTATAVAVTETVGWLAVEHFSNLDKTPYITEGKVEASVVYEKKFKEQAEHITRQAEALIQQGEVHKKNIKEYKELLDDYEKIIQELTDKLNRSDEENKRLKDLKDQWQRLKNLPIDTDNNL